MIKTLYPLLFEDNLYELVWGGTKLRPMKGMPADGKPIGESWEVSNIPGRQSIIKNGPLAGRTVGDLIATYGPAFLGEGVWERYGMQFPLLVKFIDAASSLSIQVHPNDALALERHGKMGKTEMWYVMAADPGATLLAGFKEQISKEEYERRVMDGSIVKVLARHNVKPGDVFYIPAGRVHAINGGIVLCEIQQSSDITYRLFDYRRLGLDGKPRELHTQLAKDAIDFSVQGNYRTSYEDVQEGATLLVDSNYFAVNLLSTSHLLMRNMKDEGSFVTLSCVKGQAKVRCGMGESILLRECFSCLIPASVTDYVVESADGNEVELLESWAR